MFLSFFAISIPAHTIFYLLTRAFYAAHDTKTPLYINVIAILINTTISVLSVLVFHFPVWSLALAFSISMIVNTLLHLILFYRKIGGFEVGKLFTHTVKMYWISFIASTVGYVVMKAMDIFLLDTTRTLHVFMLLVMVFTVYMGLYIFLSWFFNIEEIYVWGKLLSKIDAIKRKVMELYAGVGS